MNFKMQTQSLSPVTERLFSKAFEQAREKQMARVDESQYAKRSKRIVLDVERKYTSQEAARMVGCTLRQLQWWDEKRLTSPGIVGHCRAYSEADIERLRVIVRLRKCGISLQAIRRLLTKSAFQTDCRYILTDGKQVIAEDSVADVLVVLVRAKAPMVLIDRGA